MSNQFLRLFLSLAFAVQSTTSIAGAKAVQDQKTVSSAQTDNSLSREQRIFLKPGHEMEQAIPERQSR
jgi:hypothetical protein